MSNKAYSDSSFSRRSFPEKLSFTIAIALLAVLISLIFYSWFTQSNQPPILSASFGQKIRQVEQQYYVPFTVTNKGEQAVKSVRIIGKLTIGKTIEQKGEQEINFLSRDESISGVFIFTHDPQAGELDIRVTGYKLP
ncbi:TIGR02588 family protein [Cyanothece sp. BG0011]|uniref:TIGR02588 family protein n=1 Tax=Cyanothece sp. BG0011 TaxID=2082950 RepID=UPI000D1F2BA2|nr:TIGR02588 family protein [Cyanothece sp. BG0011]